MDEEYEYPVDKPNKSCFYLCLLEYSLGKLSDSWRVVYWNDDEQKWHCPYTVKKWKKYPPSCITNVTKKV